MSKDWKAMRESVMWKAGGEEHPGQKSELGVLWQGQVKLEGSKRT